VTYLGLGKWVEESVWNYNSRSDWTAEDLGKAVLEERNHHNKVVCTCKSMPVRLANREYVGRMLWKRVDENNYAFVTEPTEHGGRKRTSEFVRGSYPTCVKLERLSETETRINWVYHPSPAGSIPSWVMNFLISLFHTEHDRKAVSTEHDRKAGREHDRKGCREHDRKAGREHDRKKMRDYRRRPLLVGCLITTES
jgi:hypothetical protein